MAAFDGFDHVDLRVPSLSAVEAFYDAFMPRLGLTRKRFVWIENDDWTDVTREDAYNAVEYIEQGVTGRPRFFGVIEDASAARVMTRIAFRSPGADYSEWARLLKSAGAQSIEPCADMQAYPAIFFEDPGGTKLEICG